ncbi:hypothetical protein [Desulfovibrio sp.]|nr:hypothetical protein [Desulfovibrio sp.]
MLSICAAGKAHFAPFRQLHPLAVAERTAKGGGLAAAPFVLHAAD